MVAFCIRALRRCTQVVASLFCPSGPTFFAPTKGPCNVAWHDCDNFAYSVERYGPLSKFRAQAGRGCSFERSNEQHFRRWRVSSSERAEASKTASQESQQNPQSGAQATARLYVSLPPRLLTPLACALVLLRVSCLLQSGGNFALHARARFQTPQCPFRPLRTRCRPSATWLTATLVLAGRRPGVRKKSFFARCVGTMVWRCVPLDVTLLPSR